ncbi:MAG: tyrosine-type recombinase/integrase, partial [Bacteriovoracaceae bacterium]
TRLRDQGKSDNTLKNYRTDIQCFNRYLIEMMKQTKLSLDNIDLPQILEYGKYLQEKYQSDNSRRRRVQALRIFFDFLVERGIYSSNIVKKIPTSPKFLDIPKPTPFSDVKTLWMYLIDQEKSTTGLQQLVSRRNQLIFLLIYGSGLKVSDISGLTRKNVVFGSSPRVIIQPKKRDPYSIPLPKVFENVYRKYYKQLKTIMEQQNHNFAHLLFNANPYRILAGGISSRGLEILFEELRTKLMLHLTPKSLRQACIFKWFHDGAPESLIKEWMGVAPSYSFKSYRDCASENIYNDLFLNEMYREFTIH